MRTLLYNILEYNMNTLEHTRTQRENTLEHNMNTLEYNMNTKIEHNEKTSDTATEQHDDLV